MHTTPNFKVKDASFAKRSKSGNYYVVPKWLVVDGYNNHVVSAFRTKAEAKSWADQLNGRKV